MLGSGSKTNERNERRNKSKGLHFQRFQTSNLSTLPSLASSEEDVPLLLATLCVTQIYFVPNIFTWLPYIDDLLLLYVAQSKHIILRYNAVLFLFMRAVKSQVRSHLVWAVNQTFNSQELSSQ